jgi:hypothetical protein
MFTANPSQPAKQGCCGPCRCKRFNACSRKHTQMLSRQYISYTAKRVIGWQWLMTLVDPPERRRYSNGR